MTGHTVLSDVNVKKQAHCGLMDVSALNKRKSHAYPTTEEPTLGDACLAQGRSRAFHRMSRSHALGSERGNTNSAKFLYRFVCSAAFILIGRVAMADATAPDTLKPLIQEIQAAVKTHGGPVMVGTIDLGGVAADALMQELQVGLTRAGIVTIDEKTRTQILTEAGLAQAGVVADDWKDAAGGLGAKLVVTGTITAGNYDIRVLLVRTGEVVASHTGILHEPAAPSTEATTLTAQLRRLGDRIARGLDKLEGDKRYQRFAVLNLEEIGSSTAEKQLGILVAAELNTLLRRDHGLMTVERTQIKKVLNELAFNVSGVVADDQAVEIGKLSGAQALVVGSVAEAGDRYKVNIKVVSCESGQIVVAEGIDLPAADLVALSSEAVVLRSTTGSVYRSILLPGWGQFYNREPVKAAFFVGAEVSSVGLAIAYQLLGSASASKYISLGAGSAKFTTVRKRAKQQYMLRNVFLFALAGVHILNIVDAYVSGRTFDSATLSLGAGSAAFSF